MAYLDDITTSRDNSASILAEITASPKPSYSVHGHAYSWREYQQFLLEHINGCNRLLTQQQPFIIVSQGR